jgi:sugar phosphate isomerase/epimerase
MHIEGICTNTDGGYLDGSAVRLEESLRYASACGYDGVELSVHGLDLVVGGRLNRPQLDRVRRVLDGYAGTISVHAPDRLNLAFPQRIPGCPPELALEIDVFAACLDVCAALGARTMVYHSGLIALHEAYAGLQPLPDDDALVAAREQEVTALRELMPLADANGVTVAMENRDPHPWEVATLVRLGVPHTALPRYHAGMMIPVLVEQVQGVAHPRFGLTLDVGHLYLAANYCGFDYLEAIREASPYVRHLHGSDNMGRLGGVFDDLNMRVPYGDGDVHMPHGWGNLPHREALQQLPDYAGLYVMEIRPRFRDHLPQALRTLRGIVQDLQEHRS